MSDSESWFFSDEAHQAMALAEQEARRSTHNYTGSEHLLLGLLAVAPSGAAHVLNELGVTLEVARAEVDRLIGQGGYPTDQPLQGLTPRAQKVLQDALAEARRLQSSRLDTEHLLLGIIEDGAGLGAKMLTALGVSPADVRTRTLRRLGADER